MDTEEVSNRYVAPGFVNGLEAYDCEINLGMEENMISNEFSLKLCREYEFIMNPKEDDVEPGVVLRRSFMRLTQGIADFENETITIYPEHDPFLDSTGEEEKIGDDWDLLLDDLDFGDIPDIEGVEVPPFVCKMGMSSRNKRKQLEKFQLIYSDMGPSLYSLLEEERPVIETMAYSDKYKKILDGICIDKMKLDGEMKKDEEEAIIKIKGEALKEKEDPRAFVIPIRLEGEINLNALAYTGSDINAKPMGLLKDVLCQVEVTTIIAKFLILDMPIKRDTPIIVGRGFLYTCGSILNTIERITSTFDKLCHQMFRVAKTSLDTTESDSDDEEDITALQHVDWKPNYIGCFNKRRKVMGKEEEEEERRKEEERINHLKQDQGMLVIKICVLERKEEERKTYLKKFMARDSVFQMGWPTMGVHDDEAGSSRSKRSQQYETVEEAMLPHVHHPYLLWEGCNQAARSRYNTRLAQLLSRLIYLPCVMDWNVLNQMGCGEGIDEMLLIKLFVAGTNEYIFTSEAWTNAFNIDERIYSEVCHEFYSTYEFDEVCVAGELKTKKIIKFRLCGRAFSLLLLEFAKRLGLYNLEEIEEEGFDVYFHGGLRSDGSSS
ncbi:hypothetical protein Tco_0261702 [Tanacetum coccineum]